MSKKSSYIYIYIARFPPPPQRTVYLLATIIIIIYQRRKVFVETVSSRTVHITQWYMYAIICFIFNSVSLFMS